MTRLPRINEFVLVRVGEPETVLRSRVEDAQSNFISISYPSDGVTAHCLPLTTPLTLEWLADRGLGRVTGSVVAVVDVGVPAIKVELSATPVVVQRRDHARADMVLEIDVWRQGLDAGCVSGVTIDVSGGGLRAAMRGSFEPDSFVRLSLDMPTGQPVAALARVVAQRDDGVVAFEFHEIVHADRERLIRAVFESNRTVAAVRRTA